MPYEEEGLTIYYYGEKDAPIGSGKGAQIFDDIIKNARKTGKKFEDPYFPADLSSIKVSLEHEEPLEIEWIRPTEIAKSMFNSKPIFNGAFDEFGVNQGSVGDCWFLAVLADVALKPDCINMLVPPDNATVGFDAGAFHFRFWCKGLWVDVVVDDRLACVRNVGITPLATNPTRHGGFWAPLVEKAYAKLYGNYGNMEGGFGRIAMLDFTGGFIQTLLPTDKNLKQKLKQFSQLDAIMSFGTREDIPKELLTPPNKNNPGTEGVSKEGMVLGHEYSILDVQDVHTKKGAKKTYTLLKLRNPWGNETEWKGDFSDADPKGKWKTVDRDLRRKSKDRRRDGEFWISFESLLPYIDDINTCRWTGHYRGLNVSAGGKTHFMTTSTFTRGNSGPVSDAVDLANKSGFYVHLKALDPNQIGIIKDGLNYTCGLYIYMMYLEYKNTGDDPSIPEYGFHVVWGPGKTTIPSKEFLENAKEYESLMTSGRRDTQFAEDWPEGTAFIFPWITELPKSSKNISYLLRFAVEGELHPIENSAGNSNKKMKGRKEMVLIGRSKKARTK